MDVKKRNLSLFLLVIVSLFLVSCVDQSLGQNRPSSPSPTSSGSDSSFDLKDIWDGILSIGKLEFLNVTGETGLSGFLRIMIFILIFALLNTIAGLVLQGTRAGTIVAAVISIITAVFIPKGVLIGIATTYSTVVSFILIGAPIIGVFLLVRRIPTGHWYWHLLRGIIVGAMVVLLFAMKSGIAKLSGL